METIATRFEKVPKPHGFDYIRIGLALCVLVSHAFDLQDPILAKEVTRTSLWAAPKLTLLPMFFAVSGFLVTASLERCRTIRGFATLRAMRLVPALAMEVTLSALILGPLVTTLPLHEYFTSPLIPRYFLNILGDPQYLLPGVFEHHPRPQVNAQLWTVPYELECYGGLALLALAGVMRHRWAALGALLIFMVAVWIDGLLEPAPHPPWDYIWSLILAFYAGCTLFLFRDLVPWNRLWGAGSLIAVLLLYIWPGTRALAMLPIAYFTVWLGMLNPRPTILAGKADYSYGVYLFAYPLQQLLWMWPPMRLWYTNALGGVVLALAVAAISWHLVEKPALRRKWAVMHWVERVTEPVAAWSQALAKRLGLRPGLTRPPPPSQ
jgi:peptidoglycan/LPS O-acetylase OafA/YrhL